MKFSFLAILFFAFLLSTQTVDARIEGNLRFGDYGDAVHSLQVLLNRDVSTRIADSGPGSPGNESYFFGQKTLDAVKRFQVVYKNEILVPNGLTQPTGFVGQTTRNKLNSLASLTTVPSSKTETVVTKVATYAPPQGASSLGLKNPLPLKVLEKTPKLFFADPYQVKSGGELALGGEFFDSTNNIVFVGDNYSIANVKSDDGKTIKVVIPSGSILPNGKYLVWVVTPKGSSKNIALPIPVIITDTPQSPPEVVSVDPPSVTLDKDIIIKGNNFTQSGNNIYSSLGNISGVSSSDGVTIKINMSAFPYVDKLKSAKGLIGKMWLTVQNDNGLDRTMYEMQIVVPQ